MKKRKRVPHRRRRAFHNPSPLLVTTRVCPHVWNLRQPKTYALLKSIIEKACDRFNTQIIEYVVLGNHIHLIVESNDRVALWRAMKGLGVRIAKRLNRLMGTSGQVIESRYHSGVIRSIRSAYNVMRYVRENFRRHFAPRDEWRTGVTIDACSSWARLLILPFPRTFLATVDPFM